jgi:hypothetical protein
MLVRQFKNKYLNLVIFNITLLGGLGVGYIAGYKRPRTSDTGDYIYRPGY